MGTLYQLGFLIFREQETTMANPSKRKKKKGKRRDRWRKGERTREIEKQIE